MLVAFYRHFYRPKADTLAAFLDAYSRATPHLHAIQIGANDGFQNDPLHKFIKRDKWHALLIEPQPYVYEQFLAPLHRNSPNVTTRNVAISEKEGILPLYVLPVQERWATGLATFDRSQLEQQIANGFVAGQARKYGTALPDDPSSWIQTIEVPTLPAHTLLQQEGITTLHLLQIDTEGWDDKMILQWDWTCPPECIIFEHIHLSQNRLSAVETFLNNKGYQLRTFGANTLAIQQNVRQILA